MADTLCDKGGWCGHVDVFPSCGHFECDMTHSECKALTWQSPRITQNRNILYTKSCEGKNCFTTSKIYYIQPTLVSVPPILLLPTTAQARACAAVKAKKTHKGSSQTMMHYHTYVATPIRSPHHILLCYTPAPSGEPKLYDLFWGPAGSCALQAPFWGD